MNSPVLLFQPRFRALPGPAFWSERNMRIAIFDVAENSLTMVIVSSVLASSITIISVAFND
jgi:hypothetical protein